MPKKVRAVLLDLDGTLRDTQEIIYSSIQQAMKLQTGKDFSREAMTPYIHHHREVYKGLVGDEGLEAFDEVYTARIDKLIPDAKLFAGAEAAVKQLHAAGYRLGLVSTAKTDEEYLRSHGLLDYFEVIVGAQHVTKIKPHPEPILTALDKLKTTAEEAVVVGDLPADIEAAKAAGVPWRIGITYGIGTRGQLEAAGATHIIDSLTELLPYLERLES